MTRHDPDPVPRADSGSGGSGCGDVAIVGMSCLFPAAPDLDGYWHNILTKVDAIGDPPADWTGGFAFDPASEASDRIYTRRGGYLGELARFDPVRFGIVPKTVDGSEPEHFLALRVAQQAIEDAGHPGIPLPRERTEVIVGRGTFVNRGLVSLHQHGLFIEQTLGVLRSVWPAAPASALELVEERLRAQLPPLDPMTAAGVVSSITSGRISNRLDLHGENYCLDAACASSLIAVEHAVRDLRLGRCDAAIAGGVQLSANHLVLLVFSRLGALSRTGRIRPFDASSDGTLLGEGVGMVVLKRRADAERDGNRVYACIKGAGSASDGRAKSIVAPSLAGEVLALERAYRDAGVDPRSIGLIEAHGTAMPLGDQTELEALAQVFGELREGEAPIPIGSVKSMIGHLIPASGMASLIKTALALHHKVVPPTLAPERVHPVLAEGRSRFRLNTQARPWIHPADAGHPRRAGVSAFGFGGINAHVVLEEVAESDLERRQTSPRPRWDTELAVITAPSREALVGKVAALVERLAATTPEAIELRDLAAALNAESGLGTARLAIVAGSVAELARKLAHALPRLRDPDRRRIRDRMGIYYFDDRLAGPGRVAFLFPGEGAQYAGMLSDLALAFPQVRRAFDLADGVRLDGTTPLRATLFPIDGASSEDPRLWEMETAVRAVTVANRALAWLADRLGLVPDAVAGHSSGEFGALECAGVVELRDESEVVSYLAAGARSVRGVAEAQRSLPEVVLITAAAEQSERIAALTAALGGELAVAMDNCPLQVVLCAKAESAEAVITALKENGVVCSRLPFLRPYHTADFAPALPPLAELLRSLHLHPPRRTIYSCATAAPFPPDVEGVRELAVAQWTRTVRFRDTLERMYADGLRIFVEVGPRGNLSAFANDILGDRPALVVPLDTPSRSGLTQLQHALGLLAAHGVDLRLDELARGRLSARCAAATPTVDDVLDAARPTEAEPRLSLSLPFLALDPASAARVARQLGVSSDRHPRAAARPPVAEATAQASNGARTRVMEAHLDLMARLERAQSEAVGAYLARGRGASPAGRTETEAAGHALPFAGKVVRDRPGHERVSRYELDLNEDRFLRDHVLGNRVSRRDPSLLPLPIVPLTMSMEMLAEAAALLRPDRTVVGMRDLTAHRWVVVEDRLPVEIAATLRDDGSAAVELRPPAGQADVTPYVTATVVLADGWPSAPPATAPSLHGARPSRFARGQLYRHGMFHGPAFRAVESVERWAEDGCTGTLRAPPPDTLFASNPRPRFLIDPVILDAAGQLAGHWNAEHRDAGFSFFPYRFDTLHLYAPPPPAGTPLPCQLHIRPLSERRYTSTIDVLDAGGRLVARLEGWEDRDFELPEAFYGIRHDREGTPLGAPWAPHPDRPFAPDGVDPAKLAWVAVTDLPAALLLGHGRIWLRALARQILSARERRVWSELSYPEPRKLEWLLGRAAAKEAVRRWSERHAGESPLHADIEIDVEGDGRPVVVSDLGPASLAPPRISITHAGAQAYAVAVSADLGQAPGLDVEPLRATTEAWQAESFSEAERRVLAEAGGATDHAPLRAWCAKESVSKAMGTGLRGHPRNLAVVGYDSAARFHVAAPTLAEPIVAETFWDAHVVGAFALYRYPSSHEERA